MNTIKSAWVGALAILMCTAPSPGCDSTSPGEDDIVTTPVSRFNTAHLEHLGEDVSRSGSAYHIIHIYADAPSYAWVTDDDEGAACVDDAARAAVVYLRHFETTGDAASAEKAKGLLRFIMYMQRDNGVFYNFVRTAALDINTTHQNSRADAFEWWSARAVWALGTGVRALRTEDPAMADAMAERIARTYPYLDRMLESYGRSVNHAGRSVPQWLVGEAGSDATSELVLGLVALQSARPGPEVATMIAKFADGIASMQYGSMNSHPYGAHASWIDVWHGWGNSQTQALSEAGRTASAVTEAEQFYPRLLVDGWMHSFSLDDPGQSRRFEQIAYAVRGVSVGLIRLYEATGDVRYAKMAGLAASWLTGNNVAGAAMYDTATGRGYDGIGGPSSVNWNSGAESTIEALFTILEVEQVPEARAWLDATGAEPVYVTRNGIAYAYRVFTSGTGVAAVRLGVIMNLTEEKLSLLESTELDQFLAG